MVDALVLWEVQLKYLVNGQTCRNVIHYRNLDSYNDADTLAVQQELLDEVNNANAGSVRSAFLAWAGTNVTVTGMSVQNVWPVRSRATKATLSLAGTNIAGECEAQNLQASIAKYGTLADRHEIGGVRIGGMPTALAADGLVNAAGILLLQAIDTAWFSPIVVTVGLEASTFVPAIANRTKVVIDGKDHYVLSGSSPVADTEVMDTIRTQRSRTVGRGE